MKKTKPNQDNQAKKWVIWGGCLITLFFWTGFNDPFNAPKSWILSIAGFWLFGWIVFQVKNQFEIRPLKWATFLSGIYIFALGISLVASDNKYISFFGEYQRKTGFLAYFCLIIFFLSSSYIFRLDNIRILETAFIIIGFISAFYGLLQHFHHDFVPWSNPYNPVLTTLGNPDFAAAVMSMFLVANFGVALQPNRPTWLRGLSALNSLFLLVVIQFSQVRQGLLTSVLGVSLILIVWIYQRKKYISYAAASLLVVVGSFSLAGMLNKGPFIKYFYKTSVSYRGDYWRAGSKMFIQHPLFGVGPDRFGAYFRQYRDLKEVTRRGPNVVSNAAHNIPIHLAATGGIFVLLAFLSFTAFILWRGISTIKNSRGDQQILASIIFAIWIVYEAQSLISIDNIGIVIWGYILGGIIVGISVETPKERNSQPRERILQPLLSGLLSLIFLIISVFFMGAESSAHVLNTIPTPRTQSDLNAYEIAAQKPLNYVFKEPTFVLVHAQDLAQGGNFQEAIQVLQNMKKVDPHNFEAQNFLAKIYEYQKNWAKAIAVRSAIIKIDPHNYANLLQLADDYKAAGDLINAKPIATLVTLIAPNTPEAKQALTDFGK